LRVTHLILPSLAAVALAAAPDAIGASGAAPSSVSSANTGGVGVGAPPGPVSTVSRPIVRGSIARIKNGVAYAPSYAPRAVQRAIWAGNQIRRTPYIWGGGHGAFIARGYDCSGAVSYVLHAAGLLRTPL
jgi:cell wall-associated NlpC family hydrolase